MRLLFRCGMCLVGCALAIRPESTAFIDVTVVPMDSERLVKHQTVLVENGRIVRIEDSRGARVPRGSRRIDSRSKYLMPALADMHVHLDASFGGTSRSYLLLFLANGITTVRCMNGSVEIREAAKDIDEGRLLGPTIYSSGTVNDGRPSRYATRVVKTSEDATRAVAEDFANGYTAIKVGQHVSREAYDALVSAARKRGMQVWGHVSPYVGVDRVLAARQDTVEHTSGFVAALHKGGPPPLLKMLTFPDFLSLAGAADLNQLPKLAARIQNGGTWVCPTIAAEHKFSSTIEEYSEQEKRIADNPIYSRLRRELTVSDMRKRFTAEHRALLRTGYKLALQITSGLDEAGVRLLVGTDAPTASQLPGISVFDELTEFVRAGLSPFKALRAATTAPAEMLRHDREFGTVAPGRRADLLLLDANPLENVNNAALRAGVMVRGRWFSQRDLDALLTVADASH
jgi:imidazolonepropionase-like amidohydrolase